MRLLLASTACVLLMSATATQAARQPMITGPSPPTTEGPLEARNKNTDYTPAFEGQTRAPRAKSAGAVAVTTVASGLARPWSLEFLPDGRMLVTEKAGQIVIVGKDGVKSAPVAGTPAVDSRGQGGLLDVAVDPAFKTNRMIYFTFSEPREEGKNGTAVASAKLVEAGGSAKLEGLKVIFRQEPSIASTNHYGSRIAFGPKGELFVTLGERFMPASRYGALDPNTHLGKVIRINKDGSAPKDNPFVGKADAKPEVWSYGHRNPQAIDIQPGTNLPWVIEHGPLGGDEINQVEAGKNYGWPEVGYGIDYSGQKMPGGATAKAGVEQPLYYWDPVIAPTGATFYTGALVPAWKGDLFISGLITQKLVRVVLDGKKVVGEEWLLQDQKKRLRDVKQGPDGALYVLTEGTDGQVLRVTAGK